PELEIALPVASADHVVRSDIPDHDGAAAVLTLRDGAFKREILQRVIFRLKGGTFHAHLCGDSFGDGPGLENAVHLQPKVIVEMRRGVFLDDEASPRALRAA